MLPPPVNPASIWTLIPILIQLFVQAQRRNDFEKAKLAEPNDRTVFDFIIVGGGSAGCVMASRLSENFNVLLLEAGGTPPPEADVPYFSNFIQGNSDLVYFYESVPQKYAYKKNGGILPIISGRMLGGTGSHNGMSHHRGSPKDFDNWAKITNDSSWSYANVLKYFKKMENFIGKRFGNESHDFYGFGGPITVNTSIIPILPIWLEAARELGYKTGDPSGFQPEGFTPSNKAIKNGKRSSPYNEYIRPIESCRKNLTVIRYAVVSEILLNEANEAYGVKYTRHGSNFVVNATKEIILSAGAIVSPLLLMKSGIGPIETLKKAEIPIKIASESVGKNLGEHPGLVLSKFHVHPNHSYIYDSNDSDYGLLGGIYYPPICFISSSKAEKGWPDIFIKLHPMPKTDKREEYFKFNILLARPKSTGWVNLNTTAYKAGIRCNSKLAIIDFKHLEHPDDLDVMIEGIEFSFKIVENTTAFQKLGMKFNDFVDPACKAHVFRSRNYWKCFLHQNLGRGSHLVGTCGIGSDSSSSVLDSKFRVRGAKNLRVVDASVIPIITNANIHSVVLMVSEKAANEISKSWKSSI